MIKRKFRLFKRDPSISKKKKKRTKKLLSLSKIRILEKFRKIWLRQTISLIWFETVKIVSIKVDYFKLKKKQKTFFFFLKFTRIGGH